MKEIIIVLFGVVLLVGCGEGSSDSSDKGFSSPEVIKWQNIGEWRAFEATVVSEKPVFTGLPGYWMVIAKRGQHEPFSVLLERKNGSLGSVPLNDLGPGTKLRVEEFEFTFELKHGHTSSHVVMVGVPIP